MDFKVKYLRLFKLKIIYLAIPFNRSMFLQLNIHHVRFTIQYVF